MKIKLIYKIFIKIKKEIQTNALKLFFKRHFEAFLIKLFCIIIKTKDINYKIKNEIYLYTHTK